MDLFASKRAGCLLPVKSCLKKLSSTDEQSCKGHSIITAESSHKLSTGNKSNRAGLKFSEDSTQPSEMKGFSLDCSNIAKKTMSNDMELNASYGMRSKFCHKKQSKSQIITFKDPKSNFKLDDDFILEAENEEEIKVSSTKPNIIIKNPSRSKSSSSIFEMLRQKVNAISINN